VLAEVAEVARELPPWAAAPGVSGADDEVITEVLTDAADVVREPPPGMLIEPGGATGMVTSEVLAAPPDGTLGGSGALPFPALCAVLASSGCRTAA